MKSVLKVFLLLLIVVVICQCWKPEITFLPPPDLSLIPGTYYGTLEYTDYDSAGIRISQQYIKPNDYKTTIVENGDSFTFIFDPDCIIKIPNIEAFQKGRYFGVYADYLSISSIVSEEYKLRYPEMGSIHDELNSANYFAYDGTRSIYKRWFDLYLESTKSDTIYTLRIYGKR